MSPIGKIAAVAMLSLATSAVAQDTPDIASDSVEMPAEVAEVQASAEKDPPKEKKICRTEKITGTRSKVNRICMTAAEWEEVEATTYKQLEDFKRASGSANQSKNPLGPN